LPDLDSYPTVTVLHPADRVLIRQTISGQPVTGKTLMQTLADYVVSIAGAIVTSVAGRTGAVVLASTDITDFSSAAATAALTTPDVPSGDTNSNELALHTGAQLGGGLGSSGNVTITSGQLADAGTGNSGAIQIITGQASGGDSGILALETGFAAIAGNTGDVRIQTGSAALASGNVTIDTGTGATPGAIILSPGSAPLLTLRRTGPSTGTLAIAGLPSADPLSAGMAWIDPATQALVVSTGSAGGLPAGSFTTLSASGAVSGAGFSNYFASPPAIGGTTAAAGSFTTLSATGTVSGLGMTARFASPGPIGSTTASTGNFTTMSASVNVGGAGFTSWAASPPSIGNTAAASGAFTTLSASSTVSGTGFSTYLASPPAIGGTTASTGRFTTVTSTQVTGAAPFTVASTTTVTNLSASFLNGATFAQPGTIGSTTPNTGAFTTLSASSTVSGAGFSTYLASPPAIGGTAAAAGSFTTLSASSTVSGTGFTTYLASPPGIGGTAPAAAAFTTLSASGTVSTGSNANSGQSVNINAAAASARQVALLTAGATRWTLQANNTAESGSNVGSDFAINRYNDAGTFVDAPIVVTRSSGVVTFNGATTVNSQFQTGTSTTARKIVNNGPAAVSRTVEFQTATAARWQINANNTAEGGSNAGSDLDFVSFADAGTALLSPAVRFVRSTGNAAFFAGASFGGTTASSVNDFTKQIALFSTTYGLTVTSNRLNIVANTGASIVGVLGTTDIFTFTSTGLNSTPVGATTASTGAFTTLTASGVASFTNTVNLGNSSGTVNLQTNGPAASNRLIRFQTAGLSRWAINANATAEGGSNAGSDLDFITYDDTGAALVNPAVRITRSNGAVTVFSALTCTGTLSSTGTFSAFGSSAGVSVSVWLNAAAGNNRTHAFVTAGSTRWAVGANNSAESGSNVGSDYIINRYDDSGVFQSTPLQITRSSGTVAIQGTNTNDNAAASRVGEVISATLASGSAVSLTTGTCSNVVSINLTAGDWDVYGTVGLTLGGSTAVSSIQAGISTTSATQPGFAQVNGATQLITGSMAAGFPAGLSPGACRQSLSATTTVYLLATVGFTVSTCGAYGVIWARRAR
jgi:hypothetical protein